MKVKLIIDVDAKVFRQASVLLDLDVPTDEQIENWCKEDVESDQEFIEGDDKAKMNILFAMMVIFKNIDKEGNYEQKD